MTGHSLWYIRQNGEVRGPFPERMVGDFILLGRIGDKTELSQDKITWLPVSDIPGLLENILHIAGDDPQKSEKLQAAKRRSEERQGREPGRDGVPGGNEQRKSPSYEALQHHGGMAAPEKRRVAHIPVIIVSLILVFSILAFVFQPETRFLQGNCDSPPAAGVNWSNCRMPGVSLVNEDLSAATLNSVEMTSANLGYGRFMEADMSYGNFSGSNMSHARLERAVLKGADLRGTRMVNANLSHANLQYAILRGADLSHATLEGANLGRADMRSADLTGTILTRALLDEAIWTDGTVCAAGSIGQCRR